MIARHCAGYLTTVEYVDGKEVHWLKELSFEEIMIAEISAILEIQASSKILREILEEMKLEPNEIGRIMEWFNSPEELEKRSKIHRYKPKLSLSDFDFFDDESLFID